MLLFLLITVQLALSQPTGQLLADRMHCAQLITERATSLDQTFLAYELCATNDVTHTVRDVGNFGPGSLALEYDEVVGIFPLIGIPSPVTLRPMWDEYTVEWVDHDSLKVNYNINITFIWNYTTNDYVYSMQGFRYTTFLIFGNSTTERVKLMYDIQDPAASKMFGLGTEGIPPEVLCGAFIFPACNGTSFSGPLPYLINTGYSTIEECAAFIASVTPPSKCPFQGRSNTAACRTTHAWASFIRPDVHCSHVSRVNPVCQDNCYPACNNCDVNAECVALFPTLFTPVYQCRCKNGYLGNGTSCAPLTCGGGEHCPLAHGTYNCTSGICTCTSTFTWDPLADRSRDRCACVEGTKWGDKCVPTGRCLENKHCTAQKIGTSKCSQYGYNTMTEWKDCLCNYGYQGGWEYPCVCTEGRREVFSSLLAGKICIAPGECTANMHCGAGYRCEVSGSSVGTCVLGSSDSGHH